MRRTARALSLAAAVGTVLGVLAPTASADPSAEVSPGSAAPDGTVTVSVLCDPADGPPPKTIEATSEAFGEGAVELKQVTGGDAEESGPTYRGTADLQDVRAAGGLDDARGTAGTGGDEALDEILEGASDETFDDDETADEEADADTDGADGAEDTGDLDEAEDAGSPADGALDAFGALDAVDTAGGGSARTVKGTCPAAPGEKGKPWVPPSPSAPVIREVPAPRPPPTSRPPRTNPPPRTSRLLPTSRSPFCVVLLVLPRTRARPLRQVRGSAGRPCGGRRRVHRLRVRPGGGRAADRGRVRRRRPPAVPRQEHAYGRLMPGAARSADRPVPPALATRSLSAAAPAGSGRWNRGY